MNKLNVKVVLLTLQEDEALGGGHASVTCAAGGGNPCEGKKWSSVAIIWGGIRALFCGYDVVVSEKRLESGAPAVPLRGAADVKSPPS